MGVVATCLLTLWTNIMPQSSGPMGNTRKQAASRGVYACLAYPSLKKGAVRLSETSLNYHIQGVTFQKMCLFVITAAMAVDLT
jgi:hypothetical protein